MLRGIRALLSPLFLNLLVCVPLIAAAQSWPAKPVRVVLGYSTGGTADNLGRMMTEKLSAALGQSVLIDNRPGASGNIAAQIVAKAPPDGYTVLFGCTAEMSINQHLMKDMGFNGEADFAPVVLVHNVPLGLIVSAKSSYASLKDIIDAARREPGKLSFANSGTGSPAHLAVEMLTFRSGVSMVQVPYKGAAPAMVDLLGGRIDAYFLGLPGVMPHVKSGAVRLLAVSTAQRAASLPDTPTVAEQAGIAGFNFSLWGGFLVPAGTPPEIVARLNREVLQVITQPDMRTRMAAEGSEVVRTSPQDFGRFVQDEAKKYADIARAANLQRQ
jgi:tripartite-type tricarboxylate transporter receptor subunit TctC